MVYDVVNSLLKFDDKSVTLDNANEFLKQNNLSSHFATYCKDLTIEDLEKEQHLSEFLADNELF